MSDLTLHDAVIFLLSQSNNHHHPVPSARNVTHVV
jgi:hypothetical protein